MAVGDENMGPYSPGPVIRGTAQGRLQTQVDASEPLDGQIHCSVICSGRCLEVYGNMCVFVTDGISQAEVPSFWK